MTLAEITILRRMHDRYHPIFAEAAGRFHHRTEVLAAICMRESHGGELLDANGLGDGGHGHGLMQIDDRSFPIFCQNQNWRDPAINIDFGARVLHMKRSFLESRCILTGSDLERAAIAAYNCGEGNVMKSILAGEDVDKRTSGHDFSRAVLAYAEEYRKISEEVKPEPAPDPEEDNSIWASFMSWTMNLFRRT